MRTPATIKKHPLHPMLITLPIGLFVFSLVSDIIFLAGWGPPVWRDVAFYTLSGGLVTALIAAVPGLIDYASLPESPVKKTATKHLLLNLSMVVVFLIDFLMRFQNPLNIGMPFALSVLGVALLGYAGWLGASLVHEHGVTITDADSRDKTIRPSETDETDLDYRKAA